MRMSAFFDTGSIRPQQIWASIKSRSVHGENLTLAVLELDAASDVPEHSHLNEQLGVLLQGSVVFTIGEETDEVSAGGMWVIPAHVPHSVKVGPEGAIIVEAFSPPRHDWGAIETLEPGPGRWP
jgi:quercetin dioxygenase-like cupin family protein